MKDPNLQSAEGSRGKLHRCIDAGYITNSIARSLLADVICTVSLAAWGISIEEKKSEESMAQEVVEHYWKELGSTAQILKSPFFDSGKPSPKSLQLRMYLISKVSA